MANEKGTGQHAHKSSEEPYAHHEAPTTSKEGKLEGRGESRTSRTQASQFSSQSSSSRSSGREGGSERNSGEASDLKRREYRCEDGHLHHHTHTAESMKGTSSERTTSSGSDRGRDR